jgi:nucleoside-diphosphate-sugar epimerase
MSFTPTEIAAEIKKHIPEFTISYKPDFRQKLLTAGLLVLMTNQRRLGWKHEFDLESMTVDMLEHLKFLK